MAKKTSLALDAQVAASLAFASRLLALPTPTALHLKKEALSPWVVHAHHCGLEHRGPRRLEDQLSSHAVALLPGTSVAPRTVAELPAALARVQALVHGQTACVCLLFATKVFVVWLPPLDKILLYACPAKVKVVKNGTELLAKVLEDVGSDETFEIYVLVAATSPLLARPVDSPDWHPATIVVQDSAPIASPTRQLHPEAVQPDIAPPPVARSMAAFAPPPEANVAEAHEEPSTIFPQTPGPIELPPNMTTFQPPSERPPTPEPQIAFNIAPAEPEIQSISSFPADDTFCDQEMSYEVKKQPTPVPEIPAQVQPMAIDPLFGLEVAPPVVSSQSPRSTSLNNVPDYKVKLGAAVWHLLERQAAVLAAAPAAKRQLRHSVNVFAPVAENGSRVTLPAASPQKSPQSTQEAPIFTSSTATAVEVTPTLFAAEPSSVEEANDVLVYVPSEATSHSTSLPVTPRDERTRSCFDYQLPPVDCRLLAYVASPTDAPPVRAALRFISLTPSPRAGTDRSQKLTELREQKLRQIQARRDNILARAPLEDPKVAASKPSNRQLIQNAVEYTLLAGVACEKERRRVVAALVDHPSDNFVLAVKGAALHEVKMTYRGLYALDATTGAVTKVIGAGPPTLDVGMVKQFFRYNSGKKAFVAVSTRSFTVATDAAALTDDCYRTGKKKPTYL
ncbi:hypothetical protein ACHHYP_14680 [Achlya hypogyna]|uniref:CKK domain-containing protein n=1 Tax=Achlya hypogyna TaxID=1202772 RepID=A0A1V9YCP6_ACHHY|nr:hypothetical protein ACHHYP_14680 [Achlya hypogyna]